MSGQRFNNFFGKIFRSNVGIKSDYSLFVLLKLIPLLQAVLQWNRIFNDHSTVMNKRQLYVSGLIISSVIILSQCIGKGRGSGDMRGKQFAEASSCATCHKTIYDSYVATAHYHTSSPASLTTIKGSFTAPDNIFHFSNATDVIMEKRDSGLFQAAYANGKLQEIHRFDITVGSGRKAQTYLYWLDGKYFQLPLSYFVPAQEWANSPGFPASHPKFDRLIPSTCFGCHTSMVGLKDVKLTGLQLTEEFEKGRVAYGIDCQRCHGPAADHVDFHSEHPQEKEARFMTKIDTLKNLQKLDMCALCHSGLKPLQKSAFLFKPGEALADYILPTIPYPIKPKEMDVHGNQLQLLTASKCFIKSKDMNCSSCHDPHTTERNMQMFSTRCMNCHNADSHNFCKMTSLPSNVLQQNCIDCHMPALPSSSITLLTDGQKSPTPDSIRTHLITIYPDATKKIMARLQKSGH